MLKQDDITVYWSCRSSFVASVCVFFFFFLFRAELDPALAENI